MMRELEENANDAHHQSHHPKQASSHHAKEDAADKAINDKYKSKLPPTKGCYRLKWIVEQTIFWRDQKDPASKDLRGRLGAQILNSVINAKRFTKDMAVTMVASLVGTGAVAIGLDVFAWPAIIAVAVTLGFSNPATLLLMVILNSFTALFAEAMDSVFIKRLIVASRGGSLLPKNAKQFWADLKDALKAGFIAMIGSIPNNALVMLNGFQYMPLQATTMQIASSTSAAMVPLELRKMHDFLAMAVLKRTHEGWFTKPQDVHKIDEEDQKRLKGLTKASNIKDETLRRFIKHRTSWSMDIEKTSRMARNSMGIGAAISFFVGFLPVSILSQLGMFGAGAMSETIERIVSNIVNTPTEAISMTVGTVTANQLGAEWMQKWMSTDAHKNKQMVRLIFDKSLKQMTLADDAAADADAKLHQIAAAGASHHHQSQQQQHSSHKLVPITDDEVWQIYHSRLCLTLPFGKTVIKVMNGIVQAMLWVVSKAFNMIYPDEMINRVDVGAFVAPMFEKFVESYRDDLVYLIQYPRTSRVPSLSPAALKLECWLKIRQIPFHRVSNSFFLTALHSGRQLMPMVELNGKRIGGHSTHVVIEQLELSAVAQWNKQLVLDMHADAADSGEKRRQFDHFRTLIDDVLEGLLMYDRHINMGWVSNDEAVKEQMVRRTMKVFYPNLLKHGTSAWWKNKFPLTDDFWRELFETGTAKQQSYETRAGMLGIRVGVTAHEWALSIKEIKEKHVPDAMKIMLEPLKNLLDYQLKRRKYKRYNANEINHKKQSKGVWHKAKPFASYDKNEIAGFVIEHMHTIAQQLSAHKKPGAHKFYLFGDKPTPMDASLFGYLVQFFDTQLNIDKLRDHFGHIRKSEAHPQRVLFTFYEQMKRDFLSVDGHGADGGDAAATHPEHKPGASHADADWHSLTSRPWPQNWEPTKHVGAKYDGPYAFLFEDEFLETEQDDETAYVEYANRKKDEIEYAREELESFEPLLKEDSLFVVSNPENGKHFAIDMKFMRRSPPVFAYMILELFELLKFGDKVLKVLETELHDRHRSNYEESRAVRQLITTISSIEGGAKGDDAHKAKSDQRKKGKGEKNLEAKLPLAKTIVHLMAAFLCKGEIQQHHATKHGSDAAGARKHRAIDCAKVHREAAEKHFDEASKGDSRKKSDKSQQPHAHHVGKEEMKAFDKAVREWVHYSIITFNEERAVAYEIENYGMKLQSEQHRIAERLTELSANGKADVKQPTASENNESEKYISTDLELELQQLEGIHVGGSGSDAPMKAILEQTVVKNFPKQPQSDKHPVAEAAARDKHHSQALHSTRKASGTTGEAHHQPKSHQH